MNGKNYLDLILNRTSQPIVENHQRPQRAQFVCNKNADILHDYVSKLPLRETDYKQPIIFMNNNYNNIYNQVNLCT
jgi:hypothetical protein